MIIRLLLLVILMSIC